MKTKLLSLLILLKTFTRFHFVDEETKNRYDVICEDAKRGDNTFVILKNANRIGSYTPNGGHVNKTQALMFLKRVLAKPITALLILLIFSMNVKAQTQVVFGIGASYIINKDVPAANLQLGVTFGKEIEKETVFNERTLRQKKNFIYYIQTVTSRSSPITVALRYGRNISSFQPYVGYSYHLPNDKAKIKGITGYYPEYGLMKYFRSLPICIGIGKSGKTNSLTVLLYTIK